MNYQHAVLFISFGNTSNQTRSDMVFHKETLTFNQPLFLATKAINPKIKIHSYKQ